MILVDTNILIRYAQRGHPQYASVERAVTVLSERLNTSFVVAPQSIYEMYVVMTRPLAVGGFDFASATALRAIEKIQTVFPLLRETPTVFAAWEDLIRRYAVIGKRAHDTRLVAVMLEYKISEMLTFNDADFRQFTEIKTLNPLTL